MTPAERRAKLEAAKALMQEVETDEAAVQPAPAPTAPATPTAPPAPAANPVTPAPAAPVTGPGGDTRQSGQPSVLETLRTVWQQMKSASTPRVTGSKAASVAKTAAKVVTTVAKAK